MPLLDLEARAEAVPQARTWARAVLAGWDAESLRDDVDLVLSELLANAVLHAPGAARIVLERADGGVRLEVRDLSATLPVRRQSGSGTTTGRGLNLVAALSRDWGVVARDDGDPGKAVWCLLTGDADEQVPDLDLDALLDAFTDEGDDGPAAPQWAEVHVGEAPVGLLREAEDHLDGLLREIALAEGAGGLPREVVEPITAAVRRVAEVRGRLRALLTAATARGDDRLELVLRVPVDLADAGQQYLDALAAANAFARDRRMLSLESPVEHRVLREWWVGRLVAGLRATATGGPPLPDETLETRLLLALHRVERRFRAAERSAQLQHATAGLAAAETVEEIARIAAAEGMRVLGASGAALTRSSDGGTVAVYEAGSDVGLTARYAAATAQARPTGPSTEALRTGRPVLVESREEREARFPGLAAVQPDAAAVAALPLVVAGEVVGALRFSWHEPHLFTEDERALLEALAVQTGQAVARAEALRRLQALRDELDRLLQTSGQVSGTDLGVLRTLYGDAPVGLAVLDEQGRYLRINEVLADGSGQTAAQHVGRTMRQMVAGHEDESEQLHDLVRRVFATGAPVEAEVTGSHGRRTWRTAWFPVRNADTRVEAAVALAIEITDQRRAEARTRLLASLGDRLSRDRSEAGVLAAVADALVPDLADWVAVHLRDGDGAVRCPLVRHTDPVLQPALDGILGSFTVTPDQPYGAGHVLAHGRTQRLPQMDDAMLETIAGDDSDFAAAMRAVGSSAGAVVPLVAGGQVLGALSAARQAQLPLTDEDLALLEDVGRRAGASLQGVRALSTGVRLEIALDAADVGSYEWNVRTGHLDWDDRLFRLLDVDPLNFDGTLDAFFARLHPDDEGPMHEALQRAVQEVGDLETTYRIVLSDGTVRWLEARGRALPGADGETERLVGVAVDVTHRQQGRERAERTLEHMAQRTVAESLQRSLLPSLPTLPGVALGAAYQPSSSAALVGGDWYDAFGLPEGAVGLVIGDVLGHDVAAAAGMGQLQAVLRTCAADGDDPARVLDRLDRLVSSFAMADLATVVHARLDRRPGGGGLLTWSNAGHPAPLLLVPGGAARYLDGGRGAMVGAGAGVPRSQAVEQLPPGSTVLMFTDGLVERRGHDLDAQLEELARTAARLLRGAGSPQELCDRLLEVVRRDGGTDDAAVVALRLLP